MKLTRVFTVSVILTACSGGASAPPLSRFSTFPFWSMSTSGVPHSAGLGKVLSSKKGGEIYGFDIDQNGNDGFFTTALNVETFDQDTGAVTAIFPKKRPRGTSYSAAGIGAGDVGLVVRYVVPNGSIYAKRFYEVMSPLTADKFTAAWTPPVRDIQVEQMGPNQTTGTTAIFAIELKHRDRPDVFSSDIATNRFGKVFHLNSSYFSLGDQPQFAQDTATDQAVIATSPDGGRVGGEAPLNVLIDLKTGMQIQFTGLNNGYYGAGFVNGMAVDSKTGIAATTTELNAQVEFYDLARETGTFAQLPCTGDTSQYNSAWAVASDPVNKLFLVMAPVYCTGSRGSAILVYDESANLVETIIGFTFPIGVGAPAINPSKRMGWATGPSIHQLQQFFY